MAGSLEEAICSLKKWLNTSITKVKEAVMNREEAIKLSETKWWEGKSDEEIAEFQIHEPLMCCPFEVFHKAVETWLGRPVWTHEFADPQALIDEKAGKRDFEGPIASIERIAPGKPIIGIITD